jgi:hypothetical protein
MDHSVPQQCLDRMPFRPAHVFDLLDGVVPIHTLRPVPPGETAQQLGLVFQPEQDVLPVELVLHASF